jgi:hypothetical protein
VPILYPVRCQEKNLNIFPCTGFRVTEMIDLL